MRFASAMLLVVCLVSACRAGPFGFFGRASNQCNGDSCQRIEVSKSVQSAACPCVGGVCERPKSNDAPKCEECTRESCKIVGDVQHCAPVQRKRQGFFARLLGR